MAGTAASATAAPSCSAAAFLWSYNSGATLSANPSCPTTPWLSFGSGGAYPSAASFTTPSNGGAFRPTAYRVLLPAGAWASGGMGLILQFQGRPSGDYILSHVSIALREPGSMNAQEATWVAVTFGALNWTDNMTLAAGVMLQSNPVPFCVAPAASLAFDLVVTFLSTSGASGAPARVVATTTMPALMWASNANAAEAATDWRWDGLSTQTTFTPTAVAANVPIIGVHSIMAAQAPSTCALPVISSIAPSVVPVGVAVTLTLTGSFGSRAADLHKLVYGRTPFSYTAGYEGPCAATTWVSSTTLLCVLRAGGAPLAGSYAMVVGVLGQTASATFTAQAPPAITSLHPHQLSLSSSAPSRTVTVTGARFGNVASELLAVRFGSSSAPFAPCESFAWQSDTSALCVLPLLGLTVEQGYVLQVEVGPQLSPPSPFPSGNYDPANAGAFWVGSMDVPPTRMLLSGAPPGSALYTSQHWWDLTLEPVAPAAQGNVTVRWNASSSLGAGALSPTVLSSYEHLIPTGGSAPRSIVIQAPAVAQTLTLNFSLTGPGLAHYLPPLPLVLTILPRATLALAVTPHPLYISSPSTVVACLSEPAGPGGVVVSIRADAALAITPESIFFPEGASGPLSAGFLAPGVPQTLVLFANLTGPDQAHYEPLVAGWPLALEVRARGQLLFAPGLPAAVRVGSVTNFSFAPSQAPWVSLGADISTSAGSVVPGGADFLPANWSAPFVARFLAPGQAQLANITLLPRGTDAAGFGGSSASVVVQAYWSLNCTTCGEGVVWASGPLAGTRSLSFSVGLTGLSSPSLQLSLSVSCHADSPGCTLATPSPSALSITGSAHNFTLELPELPWGRASQSNLVHFIPAGLDAHLVEAVAPLLVEMHAQYSWTLTAPSLHAHAQPFVYLGQSLELEFVPAGWIAPGDGPTVFLEMESNATGATFSPGVLSFGDGSAAGGAQGARHFTFTAPSLLPSGASWGPPQVIALSASLRLAPPGPGIDSWRGVAPPPLVVELRPRANITVLAPGWVWAGSTGQKVSFAISAADAPNTGLAVTLQHSCDAGSVAPPSLSWSSTGAQTRQLSLSAPSYRTEMRCTFSLSGTDSAHYAVPDPIRVRVLQVVTLSLAPTTPVLYAPQTLQLQLLLSGALAVDAVLRAGCLHGRINGQALLEFALHPGNSSAQPWAYTLPAPAWAALPPEGAVESCTVNVTQTSEDVLQLAPSQLQVSFLLDPDQPPALALVRPGIPAVQSLYAGQASPQINLTVSGWDRNSNGDLDVSYSAVLVAGAGQLVPASPALAFAPGGSSNTSSSFVFVPPSTVAAGGATAQVNFTCMGSAQRCALVELPAPLRFFIQPRAMLALQPIVPAFLYPGMSFPVVFQPSQAPLAPGGAVLALSCTAGGAVSPASMVLPAGSILPGAFAYTSPRTQRPGGVNCTAVVSGAAVAQFEQPASVRFAILAPAPFLLAGTPPASSTPGSNFTFTLRPSEQPRGLVRVTMSLVPAAAGGRLSPSSVTFSPGNWSSTEVSITAPGALGLFNITFSISGEDALHYRAPDNLVLNVSDCAPGTWGPSCLPCAPCDRGVCAQGVAGDGRCTCSAGWAGADCSACAAGFFGSSCAACPACGVHGACADTLTGSGSCVCSVGWAGPACSTCAAGFFGHSCSACPSCGAGGSCADTIVGDGRCVCATGWAGLECAQCAPGFFGPACTPCPSCGAHGSCADTLAGNGQCLCASGWTGDRCDTPQAGLFPLSTTSTGMENGLVPVGFNASTGGKPAYTVVVLTLPGRGTLWQTGDGSTPGFQIASVPSVVADAKNRVLYRPPADQSSAGSTPLTSFTFTVRDAAHGQSSSTATAHIVVLHVNRAPVISVPAGSAVGGTTPLTVYQTRLSPLLRISVADVDVGSGRLLMRLSVATGALHLSGPAATTSLPFGTMLHPAVSRSDLHAVGASNATLLLNATLAELNAVLAAVRFQPPGLFFGPTTLSISLSDQGNSGVGPAAGLSASVTVALDVVAVNQPIRFNASMLLSIAAREDEPLLLAAAGLGLGASDFDAYYGDVSLNISVQFGSLSYPPALATQLSESNGHTASPGRSLQLTGTLQVLNKLMRGLTYLPATHWFGLDDIKFAITDNGYTGLGGPTFDERRVAVDVSFVDRPAQPLSASYTLDQGGRVLVHLNATDFHLSPDQLTYNLTVLPDPACGSLFRYDAAVPSRRGLPLLSAPVALTDPPARVWFSASAGRRSNAACFLAFRVTKPSGLVSTAEGVVRFVVLPQAVAPFVPDLGLTVHPNRALVVRLGGESGGQGGGGALVYYLTTLPDADAGALFQYDALATDSAGAAIAAAGVQVSDPLGRVLFVPKTNATVAAPGDLFAQFAYAGDTGARWSGASGSVWLRMYPPIIPRAPSFNVTSNEDALALVAFFPDHSQANLLRLDAVVVCSLPARGALYAVGAEEGTRGGALALGSRVEARAGKVQVIFAPEMLTHGSDYASFLYTAVADPLESEPSQPGLVTLHIAAVAHAPLAQALSFANFSSSIVIKLNASSVDEGVGAADFKASIKLFPARGSLSQYPSGAFGPGGEVTDPLMRVLYTPEAGSDAGPGHEPGVQVYYAQFLYTVTARRLSSFPARVALYVGATHIGPVAAPLRLSVAEGSTATLALPGTDPKGGPVTATVLSLPPSTARGTLRQMGGQLLLPGSLVLDSQLRVSLTLPSRGHGADFTTFTYRVTDSEGLVSAPGTVVIDVTHVPLPPLPIGGTVRGLRDLPVAVVLNGTSTEDGGIIRANLTTLPSVGAVHRCAPGSPNQPGAEITLAELPLLLSADCPALSNAPVVWFVPPLHAYSSEDAFGELAPLASLRFGVHDGVLPSETSQEATMDLIVAQRIYAPVVFAQSVSALERESLVRNPVPVDLEGSDLDGEPCIAVVTSLPSQGKLYLDVNSGPDLDQPVRPEQLPFSLSDPLDAGPLAGNQLQRRRIWWEADAHFHGTNDSFSFLLRKEVGGRSYFSEEAVVSLEVLHRKFAPRSWNVTVALKQSAAAFFQLPVYDRSGEGEGRGELALRITSLPERGALFNVPAEVTLEMVRAHAEGAVVGGIDDADAPPLRRRRLLQSDSSSDPSAASASAMDLSRVSIPFPLGAPLDMSTPNSSFVTHPLGLVAFVPVFREFGQPGNDWLYASFRWTAENAFFPARHEAEVRLAVRQEYQKPVVAPLRSPVETNENEAVVLGFDVVVDDLSALVALTVAIPPAHGFLCAFAPSPALARTLAERPCGLEFGSLLPSGAQVFDEQRRVAYMPDAYYFGADRFALQARDSKGGLSPMLDVASQRVAVRSVNQTPLVRDAALAINTRTESLRLNLSAWDPDPEDTIDSLRFFVLEPPSIGVLHVQAFLDDHALALGGSNSSVPAALRAQTAAEIEAGVAPPFSYPLRVARESLRFDAAGAGASFPYARIRFSVMDRWGNNASATIQLLVECDVGRTVAHVWHGGAGGPLCLPCPTGASCSYSGAVLPASLQGFWQSEYRQLNQPVFVPCSPASACVATPFVGTHDAENTVACASGYASRMCGRCASGFYSQGGACQACASTSSTFLALAIFGVPIVAALCTFLWLARRLELDMTFISISINFFQTVATFKSFALHWPESSAPLFRSFSLAQIDLDILSIECGLPAVSWFDKWAFMMLLPAIMLVLIVAGCAAVALGQALAVWRTSWAQQEPRGLWSCIQGRWGSAYDRFVFYFFSFLSVIFLPLTQKALSLLTCQSMPDGTSILVASPSLRCDSDWWREVRPWGYAATLVYAAGIPLLFACCLFRWRPPKDSWRFLGCLWCPHSTRSLFLSRSHLRKDALVAGAEEQALHTRFLRWRAQFQALVRPFREKYASWSMVIVARSLLVSLIAVCMTSAPLWQASLCLAFLLANLAAQVYARPFRNSSGLNQLEIAAISTQIFLLFLGLNFYASWASSSEGQGGGGSARYPRFYSFLSACMTVAVAACGAVMLKLFVEQLLDKFPNRLHAVRRFMRWLDPNTVPGIVVSSVPGSQYVPIDAKTAAELQNDVPPMTPKEWIRQISIEKAQRVAAAIDSTPRACHSRWFRAPRSARLIGLRRSLFAKGESEADAERQVDECSLSDGHDSRYSATVDAGREDEFSQANSPSMLVRQRGIRLRLQSSVALHAEGRGTLRWRAAVRSMIARARLNQLPMKRAISVEVDYYCAEQDEVAPIKTPVPLSRAARLLADFDEDEHEDDDDEDGEGDDPGDELPLVVIPPALALLPEVCFGLDLDAVPPTESAPSPQQPSKPAVSSSTDQLWDIRVLQSSPCSLSPSSGPVSQRKVLPPVVRPRMAGGGVSSGRRSGEADPATPARQASPLVSQPASQSSSRAISRIGSAAGSPSMSPLRSGMRILQAGSVRSSSPLWAGSSAAPSPRCNSTPPEMSSYDLAKGVRLASPLAKEKAQFADAIEQQQQQRPSLLRMTALAGSSPLIRALQQQQQSRASPRSSLPILPRTNERQTPPPRRNSATADHPLVPTGLAAEAAASFLHIAPPLTPLPGAALMSRAEFASATAQERATWQLQLQRDQIDTGSVSASSFPSAVPSPAGSPSPAGTPGARREEEIRAVRAAVLAGAVTSPSSKSVFTFDAAPVPSFTVAARAALSMLNHDGSANVSGANLSQPPSPAHNRALSTTCSALATASSSPSTPRHLSGARPTSSRRLTLQQPLQSLIVVRGHSPLSIHPVPSALSSPIISMPPLHPARLKSSTSASDLSSMSSSSAVAVAAGTADFKWSNERGDGSQGQSLAQRTPFQTAGAAAAAAAEFASPSHKLHSPPLHRRRLSSASPSGARAEGDSGPPASDSGSGGTRAHLRVFSMPEPQQPVGSVTCVTPTGAVASALTPTAASMRQSVRYGRRSHGPSPSPLTAADAASSSDSGAALEGLLLSHLSPSHANASLLPPQLLATPPPSRPSSQRASLATLPTTVSTQHTAAVAHSDAQPAHPAATVRPTTLGQPTDGRAVMRAPSRRSSTALAPPSTAAHKQHSSAAQPRARVSPARPPPAQ